MAVAVWCGAGNGSAVKRGQHHTPPISKSILLRFSPPFYSLVVGWPREEWLLEEASPGCRLDG